MRLPPEGGVFPARGRDALRGVAEPAALVDAVLPAAATGHGRLPARTGPGRLPVRWAAGVATGWGGGAEK